MAESAETSSPPKPSAAPKRSLWQWLWRSAELAQARQGVLDVPAPQRARLKRAETALELAERAVEAVDPLRSGPSLPLALSLYREAAYWALSAQSADPAPADLAAAWARVESDTLTFAAGSDGLEPVRTALLTKSFRETADDTPEQQKVDARAADAFVKALIQLQLGPERRVGRALVQRWVRSLLALAILLGLVLSGLLLVSSLSAGPDLAAGKPWKPSSTNDGVPKAPRGEYFFHTQDEDNPWLEIDLRRPTEFSVVEVVNRRECCPDRAIPMAVEVSTDRKRWKEVSRRTDSFSVWKARFAPTKARYVRVRVLRHSILHLAAVAVRAQ